MTNLSEFTFLSSDGKTQLHGMLWEPEGVAVRAVLQICHGVAEHIARYDGFARALNEQGIAVAGHDHLGHGKSLPEGGTPVYFGQGSTWNTVVDDIYILHQRLKQRYPDVPLCIMGHSMGSFLTRTYLIRYPGTVKAAVIMGTGWQPRAAITGGLALANAIAAVSGWRFGSVKVCFDATLVATALVLSLLFFHRLQGLGAGTILSALAVGRIVNLYNPRLPLISRISALAARG